MPPRPRPIAYRGALATAVSSEAKAYGFIVVVWTSGAVQLATHGEPGVGGALSFLGGVLAAMAVVVAAAFGSPFATWTQQEPFAARTARGTWCRPCLGWRQAGESELRFETTRSPTE
jgi:hypothetical protein